jgi:thymidylate synthase (FAD)
MCCPLFYLRKKNVKIEVLDHGYVELIECWGQGKFVPTFDNNPDLEVFPDEDFEIGIIEAARQSTQGGFRGWDEDNKLLSYLFHNNHATPFEFSGMVVEVQAPIFVFREWHRHRTQSYNEMSARYAPLPDLNYVPSVDRLKLSAGSNKQAQGTGAELTDESIRQFRLSLVDTYDAAESRYQLALMNGVPKELARLHLPVARYSKMRASASLRNWLQFLSLRADPLAQWEIRMYACAVGRIIKEKFPKTYAMLPPSRRLVIEESR